MSASVDVEATLKILSVHIPLGAASIDRHRAPAPVRGSDVPPLPAEPATVELRVLLQPTVVYDRGPRVEAVVGLLVACPPPAALRSAAATETPMETLLGALEAWLLQTYANDGGGWPAVLDAIGSGRAPATWDADLTTFLTKRVRFTLMPVVLKEGGDDLHAGAFPMFPALQVTWNGADKPLPFSLPATADGYAETVEAYFAALSLSGVGGAAASNDSGASVASFVFDDYFLTVARHVARTLADKDVASADLAREVAGVTSRRLLNGLRLPPADTPRGTPPESIALQPGYALDGQQVAVTTTGTTYSATLSLDPAASAWNECLVFPNADGTVTSSMRLASPPAEPKPVWNGPGATITVAPLPAARPRECWASQRMRMPWDQAGTQRVVVPLPPDVLALTAAGAAQLTAQTTMPGTTPVTSVALRPALAIPLRLHLVPATPAAALDGAVTDPYLTYVYRIDGTDDTTRARIEQLLAAGVPDGATVDLLYDATTTGYVSDRVDPAVAPALIARTNLSTVDLGPVSAPFSADTLPDLLRLVREASVAGAGGSYLRYETADDPGQPLPRSLFDVTGDAPVTLLVSFPAGPFQPWHDSCVLDEPLPADAGSLYLGPSTKAGPVTALGPSYPAGCVAFRAAWTGESPLAAAPDDLYTPAWIASLYHLLRFRVDGADGGQAFGTSLWSVALSETDDHETGGTSYRQVVPVSRSLTTGEQPYGAVGGRPRLEFRVEDVFGNALDDATYATPFPVAYSDPILPPGAWSGVRVRYSFQPLPKPSLCLSFAFDPQAAGPAKSEQRQSVRFAYDGIAAQLADPRLAFAVTTTVLPANGGVVDDGTLLRPALRGFVDDVIAQLADPEPAAVTRTVVVPIDPTDLAHRTDDVFAVGVTIAMSRPVDLVYADALGRRVPGSDTASTSVPPDIDPAAGTDVRLNAFAAAFEATFAKFDGTDGVARLLVRTGTPDLAAPGGEPPLWALRWSETHGVWVGFSGAPAYFSMAPLSTKPMAGDAQTVVSYDGGFVPSFATATFAGIDLDEWARGFLAAMDRLAAPDAATVFAAATPATYTLLMDAKAVLAKAISLGVQPVFAGETGGDVVTAQDELEQASLSTLGSAYTVSSIVQVPATVKVAGDAERDATVPPRFFGPVTAAGPVTTTTATLPMRATSADAPSFLTFLVTATEPNAATDVVMDPTTYAPRFVEHRIDVADRDYGYVPSQWLRVALPREDDFLDMRLGRVDAPVPVRRVPSPPSLTEQTATQSPPGASDFAWDYGVGLTLLDVAAQDALWLDVTYNLPLSSDRAMPDDADLLQALFGTLATFTSAWTFLGAHVDSVVRAQAVDATTVALLGAVWDQIRPVAEAWADLRGIAVPWTRSVADAAPAQPEPVVARTDHYMVSLEHFASGRLEVFAQAPEKAGDGCDPDAIVWPAIDGSVPVTEPRAHGDCWYKRDYRIAAHAPGAFPLSIVWRALDALTRQTARTSCYVVRNADLSATEPPPTVNDAFVYRTAVAAFTSPVVPLLVVPPRPVTPAEPTLAATLATALAVVARTGSVEADRYLRIEVTYSFRLGDEADVRSTTAVLLANDVHLVPDSRAAEGTTLAALTASLADNATTWWNDVRPSTVDAELGLSVVLFANVVGAFLPLVRFVSIPAAVPDGWWPAGQ